MALVGTVIGWFFAVLGILLLLVLVLPATVGVDFTDGVFSLWARVLCIKLRILPARPRPEKEETSEQTPKKDKAKKHLFRKKAKAKKAENQGEEQEEKPKKKKSLEDILTLVRRVAAAAGTAVKWILRGLCVRDVDLVVPVHGQQAADVVLSAGRIQMAIGATRAVLENLLRIRYKRLVVLPDFTGQMAQTLHFACKITAPPGIMLVAGVAALLRFAFWKKRAYTLAEYKAYQRAKAAGQTGGGGNK